MFHPLTKRAEPAARWWLFTGKSVPHFEIKSAQRFKGHTRNVYSLAYSPDGRRIVSGGADQTARVWDAGRGTETFTLEGAAIGLKSVSFSSDGTLVYAKDVAGAIRSWRVQSGEPLPPPGPADFNNSEGARTPGRNQLAFIEGPDIHLHDVSPPVASEIGDRRWMGRFDREWHKRKARDFARDGSSFAVAFHLGRLILDDPDNADLKKRRDEALIKHAEATKTPPEKKP